MARRYHEIKGLAEFTAKTIVSDEEQWKKFLHTAGHMYKYPFREQMLIYAQRPDATACASLELWNEKMNCWVNKGAQGIALIDEEGVHRSGLKYVFDVKDVHEARFIGHKPKLWKMEDYFPEGFDRDQIQHVMKELYFIINSDDRYIPNLMEEYVLANCIDTMQDTINMDESLLIQMPQRDEVKTAITEYLTEECGESAEEAEEIAESRIRGIEDYSEMIDYCFYDTDFMMLDDYSAEDIVKSGVNDELGVGALEPARKRLPDGSFEYIGEPQKSDSFTFRIRI